jgi:hypothetical protein
MTGGVLALFVISAIVNDTMQHAAVVASVPPPGLSPTFQPTVETPRPAATTSPSFGAPTPTPTYAATPPTAAPTPPQPRTLLAADGAILKFVPGVPYHLKVRNGRATSLRATQGTIKLTSGDDGNGACIDSLNFPPQSGTGPWHEIERTLRACEGDAIVSVQLAP